MEIYAYGNVEAIVGVLHFLVMLFGASDFMDIVRTVIVLGFVVAACASVLQMTHRGWTWLLTVLVMYSILFVPRTSVLVTDKLGIEPPAAVANVPWFAGFVFSVKSQIGHTLVQLTETALQIIPNPKYSLPAELTYEQHGLAFGNRLIHASRSASLPDTQLRADLIGYFRNCVYPEIGKSLDPDVVGRSTEVWKEVMVGNVALVTPYTPPLGTVEIRPCPEVYGLIDARLPAQLTAMMSSFAMNMVPGLTVAAAVAQTDPALFAAYTRTAIGGASTSASEILLNNAMLNHFGETGQIMSASSADPASVLMSVAKTQAVAQTNASNAVQAQMAELASPIVRNVLEIILLGAFPVVCLMVLVSEGRRTLMVLIGYLYALVWIELWPFTFAILNYVHTIYAAKEIAAAGYIPGISGMSLLTSGNIYASTLSTSGIAGWMIVAVPTLSAALLWGFDKIVGAVPSVGAMLGAAGSTVASAASGNIQMGNVSISQHALSPQRSSAWFRSVQDDVTGDKRVTGVLGDVAAVDMLRNSSYVEGRQQAEQATRLSEKASRAEAVGRQQFVQAASEQLAGFGETLTRGSSKVGSRESVAGLSREEAANDSKAWSEVLATSRQLVRDFKITESQAASLVAAARAGVEWKVASNVISSGVSASGGVSAQLNAEQRESLQRAYSAIQSGTASEQAQTTKDLLHRLATNNSYREAVISRQEDRRAVAARFENATRYATSASVSFAKRDELQKDAEEARSIAISLGYRRSEDPLHTEETLALRDQFRRAPSDVTRALWAQGELARQGLTRPTQYIDGSSVEEKPAGRYEQLRTQDSTLRSDTNSADAANRARLGTFDTRPVEVPASLQNAQESIKTRGRAVEDAGERVRGGVGARERETKDALELRDGEGGKFGTDRSLIGGAVSNATDDVVESAKQGAVALRRKLK